MILFSIPSSYYHSIIIYSYFILIFLLHLYSYQYSISVYHTYQEHSIVLMYIIFKLEADKTVTNMGLPTLGSYRGKRQEDGRITLPFQVKLVSD